MLVIQGSLVRGAARVVTPDAPPGQLRDGAILGQRQGYDEAEECAT